MQDTFTRLTESLSPVANSEKTEIHIFLFKRTSAHQATFLVIRRKILVKIHIFGAQFVCSGLDAQFVRLCPKRRKS